MAVMTSAETLGRVAGPPRTAAERDVLLAKLDATDRWPHAAAALLADLGFRLVPPDAPARERWHLLVALRAEPSLRHFDPELIGYYAPSSDGAAFATLDRAAARSGRPDPGRQVLWGHVHVIDRVPVENRFLTFGGLMRVAELTPELTVVDLVSPGPIVRWGGHSQGTDDLSEAIGAFFGRLIVPVDFVEGAAARIDAVPAGVLYRAFLADGLRRTAAAERRGAERGTLGSWMASAWTRARADTAACDAAQRLLRELNVVQPPA
jgi:hypothetical protein